MKIMKFLFKYCNVETDVGSEWETENSFGVA